MFFKHNLSNIYYMKELYEIKVSLSPNQKKNLSRAYHKRKNNSSKTYKGLSNRK